MVVFDYLRQYTTQHLLTSLRLPHHEPTLREFFSTYHAHHLFDHLPTVLFFYLFFAVNSAVARIVVGRVLAGKFKLMPKSEKLKARIGWAHHWVSLLHAILTTGFAGWYIYNEIYGHGNGNLDRIHGYSPVIANFVSLSLGFFIWDVLACFKHWSLYQGAFAVHAVVATIALIITFKPFMMPYIPYFMVAELSTIFLNTNWFLIKSGLEGKLIQQLCNFCLIISYLVVRIFAAPYFTWCAYQDLLNPVNAVPQFLRIFYLLNVGLLCSLSQYWFWKLVFKTITPARKHHHQKKPKAE